MLSFKLQVSKFREVFEMKDIFQYIDYRNYLKGWISSQPAKGRGMISALAKTARCQPAYFSRMLLGRAQLSLEQAFAIQKSLKHSPDEVNYFISLVEYDRAGDMELKIFFKEKLKSLQLEREDLKNRFKDAPALTQEFQRIYYSSFQYAVIHTCISIPKLQTLDALEGFLKISRERIEEILGFLMKSGLATRDGGKWKVGKNRLHLGRDSTLIQQHHSNWRIEALKSLSRGMSREKAIQGDADLHYSAVVSLSEEDASNLKELWIKTLEKFSQQVSTSKEETVRALVIDFFSVG